MKIESTPYGDVGANVKTIFATSCW